MVAAGDEGFLQRGNLVDAEVSSGDARSAAQTGEALVAELQGGRHELALAYARLNLVAAWLMLDETSRARELAQVGWPQGRLFGL